MLRREIKQHMFIWSSGSIGTNNHYYWKLQQLLKCCYVSASSSSLNVCLYLCQVVDYYIEKKRISSSSFLHNSDKTTMRATKEPLLFLFFRVDPIPFLPSQGHPRILLLLRCRSFKVGFVDHTQALLVLWWLYRKKKREGQGASPSPTHHLWCLPAPPLP